MKKVACSNYDYIKKYQCGYVLAFVSQDIIPTEENWPKGEINLINDRLIMVLNTLKFR